MGVRDARGRDRLVGVSGVDLPGAARIASLMVVKSAAGVSADQAHGRRRSRPPIG
jgi:hypothetical protein